MEYNGHHLLRYKWQIEQFKVEYEEVIKRNGEKMLTWFNSLRIYRWYNLPWKGNQAKAAIGILCLFYQEGRINLCFNKEVTMVMRYANSREEFNNYISIKLQ